MWASLNGHTKVVKELIKKGADVNVTDNKGKTALDYSQNKPVVSDLLKRSGAKKRKKLINFLKRLLGFQAHSNKSLSLVS